MGHPDQGTPEGEVPVRKIRRLSGEEPGQQGVQKRGKGPEVRGLRRFEKISPHIKEREKEKIPVREPFDIHEAPARYTARKAGKKFKPLDALTILRTLLVDKLA